MYDMKFSVEFNHTVNNIKKIIHEARHMEIDSHLYGWLDNVLSRNLDDINFKMEFVDDSESYVRSNLLNLMDVLKDAKDNEHCGEHSDEYVVLNSVYDCIKEFYFNY